MLKSYSRWIGYLPPLDLSPKKTSEALSSTAGDTHLYTTAWLFLRHSHSYSAKKHSNERLRAHFLWSRWTGRFSTLGTCSRPGTTSYDSGPQKRVSNEFPESGARFSGYDLANFILSVARDPRYKYLVVGLCKKYTKLVSIKWLSY